jgi:two-component system cell cycle sensor histidine kinase/response regulator CckA
LDLGSPLHENLEKIQTTGQRAADLCKQMLAYAGKGKIANCAVDINALVADTLSMASLSVSKQVAVKQDLAAGLRQVEGDPTQLQQVVMNLVINASEAIGEHPGEIQITTGSKITEAWEFASAVLAPELPCGDYLFVQVRDTWRRDGAGDAGQDFRSVLHHEIYRARARPCRYPRHCPGASRRAIRRIQTWQGSTFRLLLPVSDRMVMKAISATPPDSQPARVRRPGKVLLVDDDKEVRFVTRAMLKRCGMDVVEACSGREALEICAEHAEPSASCSWISRCRE